MRVRLFGGLKATSGDGVPVRFATRKSSLFFAFLALSGPRGLRREQAADLLWPGRGDAQARNSLRQALADIRRWFPEDAGTDIHVAGDQDAIFLLAPSDAVDVHLFDRKLGGGISDLVEAAQLYGGDVLSSNTIPDGAEDWLRLYW